jgi:putative oxidoreductase
MPTSPLFSSTARQQSLGLAILRVVVGIIFTVHGYQKLFIMGISNVQGFFAQAHVPLPMASAPLVAGLEFFGGLALIIGLLTRLVALGLVIDMLGAIMFVHFVNGFFLPTGYEFALSLCIASLALVVGGAGSPSVDEMIARRGTP